ncbi:MAG: band 7 protein [Rhodospirillales bacterium]|nr:band 7 protein [Rhodospirillales bacterium]
MLDGMAQTIADRNGLAPLILAIGGDGVGGVTVHDGPSLPSGEIIAPEVGADRTQAEAFHNNFQEPEAFLKAGGYRGRQLHGSRGVWQKPLLPGEYAFNTFAGKVQIIPTVNFILKWVRGESVCRPYGRSVHVGIRPVGELPVDGLELPPVPPPLFRKRGLPRGL